MVTNGDLYASESEEELITSTNAEDGLLSNGVCVESEEEVIARTRVDGELQLSGDGLNPEEEN